jgi:ribosomal protein S18 acetylase RimI-like enzyme
MVAVEASFRKQGLGKQSVTSLPRSVSTATRAVADTCTGSKLISAALVAMGACDEVVLEAEVTNAAALAMYEKLGFAKTKRLPKYYLSGKDAFRLKLTF